MECYLEIYWKFNCMDVVIVYIFLCSVDYV